MSLCSCTPFLAGQGNDRIGSADRHATVVVDGSDHGHKQVRVAQGSGRTFNYAGQIKHRKATEQRGSRLKDEEYRAKCFWESSEASEMLEVGKKLIT